MQLDELLAENKRTGIVAAPVDAWLVVQQPPRQGVSLLIQNHGIDNRDRHLPGKSGRASRDWQKQEENCSRRNAGT
eukprot:11164316-Lingulodinium_polyedra.AAC.1